LLRKPCGISATIPCAAHGLTRFAQISEEKESPQNKEEEYLPQSFAAYQSPQNQRSKKSKKYEKSGVPHLFKKTVIAKAAP
jgi:hypothetical protein